MKRLLVVFTLLLASLTAVSCAKKKDNKTRLTQGSPARESSNMNTPAAYGWNTLNTRAEEAELWSQNPDASAKAFIGNDSVFMGASQMNTVALKLIFNGNQINSEATMMGLRFYDNWNDPLAYLLGSSVNRRAVAGSISGNRVVVAFADRTESGESLGQVIVDGTINGAVFAGVVRYDGGVLGEFNVSAATVFNQ